ncbi:MULTISPECIES: DUF1858 domain-containing protein [Lactobacillus]|uniref:DUF59 domain-containing protein n=1 Tax=Lactobacillus xujianguonis TaxID=2495899 RepID=A0A437SVK2_9LACO|nr:MULTISPECIES: DUF1858 domain-containing protein [Lactobacillus]RVU70959.1 DUF59 domain-containing protein [Lactobacillus xujianguonis]RVU73422.1 DUF59 domain-containing protein [Lactobacillus xujianguonis]
MTDKKLTNKEKITAALKQVLEPEIGINLVDLGLIYQVAVQDETATITMTLPVAGSALPKDLEKEIKQAVTSVNGIKECDINLVWYPVWSPDKINEAGKAELAAKKVANDSTADDTQKVINFSEPIIKLAKRYPDFVEIMADCGFTKIKEPGLLKTIGRVMTISMGAKVMGVDKEKVKAAFEAKGYQVIEK